MVSGSLSLTSWVQGLSLKASMSGEGPLSPPIGVLGHFPFLEEAGQLEVLRVTLGGAWGGSDSTGPVRPPAWKGAPALAPVAPGASSLRGLVGRDARDVLFHGFFPNGFHV